MNARKILYRRVPTPVPSQIASKHTHIYQNCKFSWLFTILFVQPSTSIHVKAASSGIPINYQYLKENKSSNFEYSTLKTHQIAFQNANIKSFWIPRIHFNLIRYAAKDGNVTIFFLSVIQVYAISKPCAFVWSLDQVYVEGRRILCKKYHCFASNTQKHTNFAPIKVLEMQKCGAPKSFLFIKIEQWWFFSRLTENATRINCD